MVLMCLRSLSQRKKQADWVKCWVFPAGSHRAEAYTPWLKYSTGVWHCASAAVSISGVGFELYQNQPNPFVNRTVIGFHLPEAQSAILTIADESGRIIYTQKGDYLQGYNAVQLDRALLNTTGALYYTLTAEHDATTRKMIQLK
jgi:hypothetical protein